MFCVLAFVALGIISIFSASHRELTREALDCVLRRVTLRPCTTGFKEKMQARLVGKILNRSPLAAKLLNKHFELLSWILFITTIVSLLWAGKGLYNFYMYGSCNGLNNSGFCALDPSGSNNKISQAGSTCSISEGDTPQVTLEGVNLDLFPSTGNENKDTVVMIGCYACEYTRKTYPLIKRLVEENPVKFVFAHYPVKDDTLDLLNTEYCAIQQKPDEYLALVDRFFATEVDKLSDTEHTRSILGDLGYNLDEIAACEATPETELAVLSWLVQLRKTNIFGTPLVFINGKAFVGPKPYRVYERAIKGLRFW